MHPDDMRAHEPGFYVWDNWDFDVHNNPTAAIIAVAVGLMGIDPAIQGVDYFRLEMLNLWDQYLDAGVVDDEYRSFFYPLGFGDAAPAA